MNAAPDRIAPAGRQIASTPRDLGTTFSGLLSRYDTEKSCVGHCIIVMFFVEMHGCSRGSRATSSGGISAGSGIKSRAY